MKKPKIEDWDLENKARHQGWSFEKLCESYQLDFYQQRQAQAWIAGVPIDKISSVIDPNPKTEQEVINDLLSNSSTGKNRSTLQYIKPPRLPKKPEWYEIHTSCMRSYIEVMVSMECKELLQWMRDLRGKKEELNQFYNLLIKPTEKEEQEHKDSIKEIDKELSELGRDLKKRKTVYKSMFYSVQRSRGVDSKTESKKRSKGRNKKRSSLKK